MKHNRVPVHVRLANRVAKLEGQLGTEPIGGGNPYHRCRLCGRSEPEISSRGHYKDCRHPGILKEIAHYRRLYLEALKDEVVAARHALHRASVALDAALDAYRHGSFEVPVREVADRSGELLQTTAHLQTTLNAYQQNKNHDRH